MQAIRGSVAVNQADIFVEKRLRDIGHTAGGEGCAAEVPFVQSREDVDENLVREAFQESHRGQAQTDVVSWGEEVSGVAVFRGSVDASVVPRMWWTREHPVITQ